MYFRSLQTTKMATASPADNANHTNTNGTCGITITSDNSSPEMEEATPKSKEIAEELPAKHSTLSDLAEGSIKLSPLLDHRIDIYPRSPKFSRPTSEVDLSSMTTIAESGLPEVVIGFDGFQVDPESKHK